MKRISIILTGLSLLFVTACNQNSGDHHNGDEQQPDSTQSASNEVKESTADVPVGYSVGDEATDFSLPATTGEKVSLADYPDAKGFIVVFTCNHCPYAKAYESRIVDLDKKYASQGYPVIAISPNDPEIVAEDGLDKMKALAEAKGYTFPYLLDEGQEIYPQYGATKTPHVFLLNKQDGKNIVRYIGAIDNNYENAEEVTERYVENAVDALLAGGEITTTNTKAIGCSIKDKRKQK